MAQSGYCRTGWGKPRRAHALTLVACLLASAVACDEPHGPCQSSVDCYQDEVCVERWCRVSCEHQEDCPVAERCSRGACLPVGGACVGDEGCFDFETCVDEVCRELCRWDGVCPSGLSCVQGACLPSTDGGAHADAHTADTTGVDRAAATDARGEERSAADAGLDAGEPAVALAFEIEPAEVALGAVFSPAITVAALDARGQTVTSASAQVTISIEQSPCPATLGGTATRIASGGVARFDDLHLDRSGAGFTLRASAPGLTPALSQPFAVLASAVPFIEAAASGGFVAGAADNARVDGDALVVDDLSVGQGRALPPSGEVPFGQVRLDDLVLLLHLDGELGLGLPDGAQLADASGRDHHAVLEDATELPFAEAAPPGSENTRHVEGVLGQALEIAVEDRVFLGDVDHVDLDFAQRGFTWALWARATACGPPHNEDNEIIIGGHGDGTGHQPHVWIGPSCPSGEVAFTARDSGDLGGAIGSGLKIDDDDSWHHLVGVVEGLALAATTSAMHLYVDAQRFSRTVPLDPAAGFTGWDDILLGDFPGLDSYASSMAIDELAMWRRPLAAGEVAQLHARQLHERALGQYTSTAITAPPSGCDARWQRLSWLPDLPYGKPMPAGGAVEAGYPEGGLDMTTNALLFSFDEVAGALADGGTLADESGRAHDGALVLGGGRAHIAEGRLGNALYLADGAYLDLPDVATHADFDLGAGDFTWALWARFPDQACDQNQVAVGAVGGATIWIGARCEGGPDDGKARLFLRDDAEVSNPLLHPARVDDGRWHHLVAVKRGHAAPEVLLYVDGVRHAVESPEAFTGSFDFDASAELRLGGFPDGDYPTDVLIDELTLFSRALDQHEVDALRARGAFRLSIQVRGCDDAAACAGQPFIGPDGTSASAFAEPGDDPMAPPSFDLSGLGLNGDTVQYRVLLESYTPDSGPRLRQLIFERRSGS